MQITKASPIAKPKPIAPSSMLIILTKSSVVNISINKVCDSGLSFLYKFVVELKNV